MVMRESEEAAASNVEWERWGEQDPFFGVASWPGRERGGVNPWTVEEFYALGLADWVDFRQRLINFGATLGGRALEIGCGAGRLTKHMAADFNEVVGIDVSPGMLDTARLHVTTPNIKFHLGNGLTLPVDTASVDVVFSTHVFQHFDSLGVAKSNFSEIAHVLRPGGCLFVHLPTFEHPRHRLPGSDLALAGLGKLLDARARVQRKHGVPLMRGLQYSWHWLLAELPALGFIDVEISMFSVRSNGGIHHFVAARIPYL